MQDEIVESGLKRPSGTSGLRLLAIPLFIAALVGLSLYFYNRSVSAPVAAALAGETGAETIVRRAGWISSREIVFDVKSADGEIAMVDMLRRLLKSAEALKEREFDKVYLAYKGKDKFYLEGAYFKKLGEEREWQNPVYTMRTLPENVRNLDGSPAFETWEGGWLGVTGKQMEDAGEFQKQWWVNDAIGEVNQ
ncbi:hypothetical protein [Sphingomonas lenta]|uniref:hypothetical protein n=1 Tax=Sphingomonas lenta TaxID=1141887 RepID=UPI001140E551|nr:hypothetical protein [Sphingomonas lenta]